MKTQYNAVTGIEYLGGNQTDLVAQKIKKGFESNEWVTFLQCKTLNRKIIKGSKGVPLRAFGTDGEENKYFISFVVFNLDQTEIIKEAVKA